ncbi:hypothetical protein WISP_43259 [Willisornis vidua]|uniref:Uncharacterized protein n=1 Tax=Willisornis vidua TaxID=1566151 RepID=A0ABQ9DGA0_9PASS|nr:hypothetical protein WISP_43259 [Willisornis vidua]
MPEEQPADLKRGKNQCQKDAYEFTRLQGIRKEDKLFISFQRKEEEYDAAMDAQTLLQQENEQMVSSFPDNNKLALTFFNSCQIHPTFTQQDKNLAV